MYPGSILTDFPTDLNESNCMWGMVPLHNLSRAAKYEALGRPLKEVIPYVNLWRKGELVEPIDVPQHLYTEKYNASFVYPFQGLQQLLSSRHASDQGHSVQDK